MYVAGTYYSFTIHKMHNIYSLPPLPPSLPPSLSLGCEDYWSPWGLVVWSPVRGRQRLRYLAQTEQEGPRSRPPERDSAQIQVPRQVLSGGRPGGANPGRHSAPVLSSSEGRHFNWWYILSCRDCRPTCIVRCKCSLRIVWVCHLKSIFEWVFTSFCF